MGCVDQYMTLCDGGGGNYICKNNKISP